MSYVSIPACGTIFEMCGNRASEHRELFAFYAFRCVPGGGSLSDKKEQNQIDDELIALLRELITPNRTAISPEGI